MCSFSLSVFHKVIQLLGFFIVVFRTRKENLWTKGNRGLEKRALGGWWGGGVGVCSDFLDPVQLSDTDRKSLVERAETETQKAWTLVLLTGCDLDSNTNFSWFIALSSQGRRLPWVVPRPHPLPTFSDPACVFPPGELIIISLQRHFTANIYTGTAISPVTEKGHSQKVN